ncbi:MAG: DsrE family protein [Candidatus Micrarchaeota archaeon]
MKLGIVISTNEPETVWNAFRFATAALSKSHDVTVFLLGKGVESETLEDARFDVRKAVDLFRKKKGRTLGCGTCLTMRGRDGSGICDVSTMAELLQLVEDSDRVINWG